jgi:hypothetical protein
MPNQVSSTFEIVSDVAAGNSEVVNIANPGRSFRIVSILGTGVNTAVQTVLKVAAGGGTTAVGIVTNDNAVNGLSDAPAVLQPQLNCTFTSTDSIRYTRSIANSSRIIFVCIAAAGFALTET